MRLKSIELFVAGKTNCMIEKTKTIVIAMVAMFLFSCENNDNTGDVYICTGEYSEKYHYSNDCRGLNNCQGSIISISLSEAKETRSICGFED